MRKPSWIRAIGFCFLILVALVLFWQAMGIRQPAEIGTITPKGANSDKLLLSPDDEFIIVGSKYLGTTAPARFQGELSIWKMRDCWQSGDTMERISQRRTDSRFLVLHTKWNA